MTEIKNIPKHWQLKKLGEVCHIIMGQSPPSTSYNTNGIGLPFFQGKAEFTELYPVVEKWCNSPNKIAEPNDILLSVRAPVGTTNIANIKCCIGRGLAAIRYDNYKYVFYFLKSIEQELDSKGTGTTFRAISGETIRMTEIPVPPLAEQQAIVAKIEKLLSELENGKQQLLTAQQQLKVYRQSLLKWAFEGKLSRNHGLQGLNDDTDFKNKYQKKSVQSEQSEQISDSDKSELPKGWKRVKVSEISNVVRGGSPRPAGDPKFYDGKIPFLKVRDITKDSGTYLTTFEYTIKEAGLHKTRQIKPNTLLLSNSGATLGVPKICMIDATMNDGIAAFLELDQRSNLFLYYFWVSKTRELRNINMGAAQPNLNTDIIKNYEVPYCSFEEQQLIVDELESKLTVCDKIEETINQSLQQAETLRQSILKQAFEGKLINYDLQIKN